MPDEKHYEAIVYAITSGVNTLHGKGAPADMLATALMQVAVEITVSDLGRKVAAPKLRAMLEKFLEPEGPNETTH